MLGNSFSASCLRAALVVSLASSAQGQPVPLLGSSFGIPGDDATFDYVVVGGGTAGLTLATRLVEQKAGSVAVVEAGTFYELTNGNLSQVPAEDTAFSFKSSKDWQPMVDWGYMTTPQAVSYETFLYRSRLTPVSGR